LSGRWIPCTTDNPLTPLHFTHPATQSSQEIALRFLYLASLGFATLFAGCSFIPTDPGSEAVRLETPERVSACKSLGTTSSIVLGKIAGFDRSDRSIESDLFRISANAAVKQGGNVLVPIGKHDQGRQKFDIYLCP
jgi:hypothetical protein